MDDEILDTSKVFTGEETNSKYQGQIKGAVNLLRSETITALYEQGFIIQKTKGYQSPR